MKHEQIPGLLEKRSTIDHLERFSRISKLEALILLGFLRETNSKIRSLSAILRTERKG
jgi:hypothetical protein